MEMENKIDNEMEIWESIDFKELKLSYQSMGI